MNMNPKRRIVFCLGLIIFMAAVLIIAQTIKSVDSHTDTAPKHDITDISVQRSYSTAEGIIMRIVGPTIIQAPLDSLTVEFKNSLNTEGMTGEWFRIEQLDADGSWHEIPTDRRYADDDGTVSIVFNSVGYIIPSDTTLQMTVRPWFYDPNCAPGTYRLAKDFILPPYPTLKRDTAYVEFTIR